MKDPKEQFILDEKLSHYDGEDRVISNVEYLKEEEELGKVKTFTIRSTYKGLDSLVDGFRGGEMETITGPTKQGKTTVAHMLTKQFEEQGIMSMWFSYEVGPSQMIEQFSKSKVFYFPRRTQQRSVAWLLERAREAKLKYPTIGAMFIDTLDEVVSLEKAGHNHSVETGMVASEIKALAIDLDIPIFPLVHLKNTQYDTIPTEADIRDSSFIAQKSDKVLIVWRERKKDRHTGMFQFTGRTMIIDAADRRKGSSMNKWATFHFNEVTKELVEDEEQESIGSLIPGAPSLDEPLFPVEKKHGN